VAALALAGLGLTALAPAGPGLAAPASAGRALAGPAPAEEAAPPSDPGVLSYPPLVVRFPKPERVMLPNGLLVFLFPDRELPIVDLAFYLKAGSIFDPPEKAGLAELATTLMRVGGTRDLTAEQVDETLEFMAARITLAAGDDSVSGRLSALQAQFPEALRILAGLLATPRFEAPRIEQEKARLAEEIRRRWDDPRTIAELNFRLLAYGALSPWARLPQAETIARIGRDDLVAFHRRYLHPNNLVMGVAGDFEPAAMKSLVRAVFGSWARGKVTPPAVPKIQDNVPAGLHLIERPLTQSRIEIGHLGANRFDPDKFPLKILNFILGEGGFGSRLMREVRSTRGLAYGVGGGVGLDSDRGLFQISCGTRAAATTEAIEAIREIVRALRQDGPTEEEVREAKEASLNSFVFSLEGTVGYMDALLYYEFYGYPPDYLETYRDNLSRVTREQVARSARRHLDPDRLVMLVVGDPRSFARPLTTLGLGDPRPLLLEEPARPAAQPAAAKP
jgi:predicted Zn-dependent peptidase